MYTDVPSVAAHRQNWHRTGFLPIVRVIAEIWSRLAAKTPAGALAFVQRWSTSFLKMDQRLALYAAADTAVPASEAADVLVALPQSLLFFTDTTVEVFRLMHARWKDFPRKKRAEIERRIIEGPPRGRFKTDDVEIRVDRSRYDVFGEMQRAGLELTQTSASLWTAIQSKYPNWELRRPNRLAFTYGTAMLHGSKVTPRDLRTFPDDLLIDEAKKATDSADFLDGDHWQALCQSETPKYYF